MRMKQKEIKGRLERAAAGHEGAAPRPPTFGARQGLKGRQGFYMKGGRDPAFLFSCIIMASKDPAHGIFIVLRSRKDAAR